jgi:CrcB protein
MTYFYIGVFGLAGVFARFLMGLLVTRLLPSPFPAGTFAINLLGAFLAGVLYVVGVQRALLSPELRTGVLVGFLGGFTTFSAYCLEAFRLVESADYLTAGLYFGLSPLLGLAAVFAGALLARKITG